MTSSTDWDLQIHDIKSKCFALASGVELLKYSAAGPEREMVLSLMADTTHDILDLISEF